MYVSKFNANFLPIVEKKLFKVSAFLLSCRTRLLSLSLRGPILFSSHSFPVIFFTLEFHLSTCIQLCMTKYPSQKVVNLRHLPGCDTIDFCYHCENRFREHGRMIWEGSDFSGSQACQEL